LKGPFEGSFRNILSRFVLARQTRQPGLQARESIALANEFELAVEPGSIRHLATTVRDAGLQGYVAQRNR
jgi:hypothetical protein